MKGMKTLGQREVGAALARVRRLRALGRVLGPDAEYITTRLEEVSARIVIMREYDEDGEEE